MLTLYHHHTPELPETLLAALDLLSPSTLLVVAQHLPRHLHLRLRAAADRVLVVHGRRPPFAEAADVLAPLLPHAKAVLLWSPELAPALRQPPPTLKVLAWDPHPAVNVLLHEHTPPTPSGQLDLPWHLQLPRDLRLATPEQRLLLTRLLARPGCPMRALPTPEPRDRWTRRREDWTRRLNRRRRWPFAGEPRLIVHATHHKMGTMWWLGVLRDVCQHFGLRLLWGRQADLHPDVDVLFSSRSKLDLDALPPFVGTHMVRDLRDVLISGYHYHLWAHVSEPWLHRPIPSYAHRSHQHHLNRLSEEEGLRSELAWMRDRVKPELDRWDRERAEVLELRYEDVIQDEARWFPQVFAHYGFHPRAVQEATEIALRRSIHRNPQRRARTHSHVRSGLPQQWRTKLHPHMVRACESVFSDHLTSYGYALSDEVDD